MLVNLFTSMLLASLPLANAATVWQQKNYTFVVPTTPLLPFSSSNFSTKTEALSALSSVLANDSIAYPGDLKYGKTIGRVWTNQLKTYPEAIVYPQSPEEVSIVMNFYSNVHTLWGSDGFAIMGGGHLDTGGAQSPSVIIDLQSGFGSTSFAIDPPLNSSDWAMLKIGGGSDAGDVYDFLDGTGWAFLGPRAASIGVGGFLLGGGIAFQANRYGVANDNLVGLEMILLDGSIVYASPNNKYSDLFWACTGAGWMGVGVITNFYIQANPDPGLIYSATITWAADQKSQVFEKTVDFFENNTDPDVNFALVYYFKDPELPNNLTPIKDRQFTLQANAIYFGAGQEKFNETYGQFFEGASSITFSSWSLKTLDQLLLTNYPYGYNRLFYGKSHTNSTVEFYEKTFAIYQELINGMLIRAEDPGHTLWVDEYMMPNWYGAGPASDADTAWPHSTSAHITMTSGEWSEDETTTFMNDFDKNYTMSYMRDFQNGLGEPEIYDYPNYIAPHSKTAEVWGEENFARLLTIKEKYDPKCLFNRGRVFATKACVEKGVANTFSDS